MTASFMTWREEDDRRYVCKKGEVNENNTAPNQEPSPSAAA